METEKRNNKTSETSSNGTKNMEIEAATKIQAGFRGYQVRKQLKMKNNSNENSSPKRSNRRKSGTKLTPEPAPKTKPSSEPSADLEEQSAVKIQAGIRGFLVRRRQKKQKNTES